MNIPIYLHILSLALFLLFQNGEENYNFQSIGSIEAGKQIYHTGQSPSSDKIIAEKYGVKLDAKVFSCAFCHGKCGEGKLLQGVEVPAITRIDYLTRNYNNHSVLPPKRTFNSKLKNIITKGIHLNGEKINEMMPTYTMSLEDMNNLLAYLEILGTEKDCKD